MKITVTAAQLDEIGQQARRALPQEACGLIAGRITGEGDAVVSALHASENLAPAGADSFEIDPALHISLQRDLRGSGEAIIGVYHSHPLGAPEPSARDVNSARAAAYAGWLWLITAFPSGEERPVTRAFLHVAGGAGGAARSPAVFAPVEIRIHRDHGK